MTAATRPHRPRWATEADGEALLALNLACPAEGELALTFDRSPDFFALPRLLGAGSRHAVIDAPEGGLRACGALATFEGMHLGGEVRRLMYAYDLRVHPSARKGLALKRIYDFLTAWGQEEGCALGFTTVMAGNGAMVPVLQGKGGLVPYRHVATMCNATLMVVGPRWPEWGVRVRPAQEADVEAMAAAWLAWNGAKAFAPAWGVEALAEDLRAGPGQWWLSFRGGRLVGMAHRWDQRGMKRLLVHRWPASTQSWRPWYNRVAPWLGGGRLPQEGEAMPYVYLTRTAAADPGALRALYVALLHEALGQGLVYLSTMLDAKDPLRAAWRGLPHQSTAIELFALDPQGLWREEWARGPAHFDPAWV